MTKSVRMIIGLATGLILIAGGFVFGHYWHQRTQEPLSETTSTTPIKTETKPPTANATLYTVSAPSRGRAYTSVPVTFENLSGAHAIIFLKKDQAKDIKAGQNILLYDANGETLDAVGKVVVIDPGRDAFADYVSITTAIGAEADGQATKPVRGEIVTGELGMTNRLPLSALRYTSDNKPYLWESLRQDDATKNKTAKRFITGVRTIKNEFFIMDTPDDYVSNIYILNPDDALEEGQIVSVTETLYTPGIQPNDQHIADRPRVIYKKEGPAEDPLEGMTAAGGGCSTSCGASGADDFIAKIKSLAKDKAPATDP